MSDLGHNLPFRQPWRASGMGVRVQPVDATQALNLCAGAWKFKVFRGRSLS